MRTTSLFELGGSCLVRSPVVLAVLTVSVLHLHPSLDTIVVVVLLFD